MVAIIVCVEVLQSILNKNFLKIHTLCKIPEILTPLFWKSVCLAALFVVTQFVQWFSKHKQLLNPFTWVHELSKRKSPSSEETLLLIRRFFQPNSIYIFLISRRKHMLWVSLEAPHRGASNEYPQHMFSSRNKKNFTWYHLLERVFNKN